MKHPLSSIIVKGDRLYGTIQNRIVVFDVVSGQLLCQWTDTIGTDYVIKKKFELIEKQQQQHQEPTKEEAKCENGGKEEGQPKKKQKKTPKIPKPGPGAPQIYNDIRNIGFSPKGTYLIATTNSDKAVIVFKIEDQKIVLVKRQPFPKRPSSVALTPDESFIVLGDKFGDVYSIPLNGPPIEDFSEPSLTETVAGKLPAPILGHVSMLTGLMLASDSEGNCKIITADRDEHIRVSRYPDSYVIDRFCFGHRQFVTQLVIPSFDPSLLISGGGDEFIAVTSWQESDKFLQKVQLRPYIENFLTEHHNVPERWAKPGDLKEFCVSGLALNEKSKQLVVLVERTAALIVFQFKEQTLEFVKTVYTTDVVTCIGVDSRRQVVYFGVDNPSGSIRSLSLSTFEISESKIENPVAVEPSEVYPMYNTGLLRKRSEH